MNAQTVARLNAPPAKGRFPLVLHSVGRNDHQQASTVLFEYLASRGYVVANVPQVGRDILHPRLDFTFADIALQMEDVEFALGEMMRFRAVDSSRIAIMGHSAGPVVGVMLAAKNHAVDVVVSLDGSIATEEGSKLLGEAHFDVAEFRIPLLNLYRANETHSTTYFVDSLIYSDRYNIAVDPKITHFDFANWPLYSIFSDIEDPRGTPFRNAETARQFHLNMCRYVLHFLDATLKGKTASLEAITGKTETRDGSSQFRFQQGVKIARADDFVWELMNGDKNAAFRNFESIKKAYPQETILPESGLNALGTQMLETERSTDALSVFQLYLKAYPASVSARWGLAEAYRKNNQEDLALPYYREIVNMTEQVDEKDSVLKKIRNAALEQLKQQEGND